jgi:hypothetical protein
MPGSLNRVLMISFQRGGLSQVLTLLLLVLTGVLVTFLIGVKLIVIRSGKLLLLADNASLTFATTSQVLSKIKLRL